MAGLLSAFLAVSALAARPSLVGTEAPDFALKSQTGGNVRLSEFRGQVVLVNFWARWADDSLREMSALDRINTTYKRAGLVVLGVSVDEDVRRARDYAASAKVGYSMMFDGGATVGREYMLEMMPMTILIDRSGVMRYSNAGFKRGDEQAYLDVIRVLLRE